MNINEKVEDFKTNAFYNGELKELNTADFSGKWKIFFFYPADFTFVCPTELGEMADFYERFKKEGAEIFSVSTDTEFVHLAWHNDSPTIKKIKYPMLADPTGKISKDFGVYIDEAGLALRGTFVVDPDGILKLSEVNDLGIGRSASELLRKLRAAKYVRENGGDTNELDWDTMGDAFFNAVRIDPNEPVQEI